MTPRRVALALLAACGGLSVLGAARAPAPRMFLATIERVSTGDTLVAVAVKGPRLRLRLIGIDAPDVARGSKPSRPYGEEARDYLDHLIGGKTVRVDAYGQDRDDRTLVILWHNEVNVNVLMVTMGYAQVDRGAPCQVYCRDLKLAERKARRDRIGMWAQGGKHGDPVTFRRSGS